MSNKKNGKKNVVEMKMITETNKIVKVRGGINLTIRAHGVLNEWENTSFKFSCVILFNYLNIVIENKIILEIITE